MALSVNAAANLNRARSQPDLAWHVSLFALCLILGGLLGISFKAQHQVRKLGLPASNYEGLGVAYQSLKTKSDQDEATISSLNEKVSTLEQAVPSTNTRLRLIAQDVQRDNFLAGLTDVAGPGIVVTLQDSATRLPDAPAVQESLMIHDKDISSLINELKAGGAEAISVNDERVVALTAVRCAGPDILVNNTPQVPPYVIRAIGDPKTLAGALKLPDGVYDQIHDTDPSMIRIDSASKLHLPAYGGSTQFKFAVPVLSTVNSAG
ncbi:MAG: DUF881 domain-containing protein [Capsulimonadaceae bacterium]